VISRSTRIVLKVGAGLIFVLVGVMLAAHIMVSRQDHQLIRQQLALRMQALTGLELQIRGPLELPYALRPTFVFHDIVLRNPAVSGPEPLLEADELRIIFAAASLLKGEVLVYESSLSGIHLNLVVDEDGRANWLTGMPASGTTVPGQIAIHSIELDDLSLSYRNLQTRDMFDGYIDRLDVKAPIFQDRIRIDLLTGHNDVAIAVRGHLGSMEDILAGNAFPIDLSLDIEDVDVDVAGRIERIEMGEIGGFSLRLEADGGNLSHLGSLFGLTIPETNNFSIAATLSIVEEEISASDISAEIAWQDSEIKFVGEISDIDDLAGLNLVVEAVGGDLSDFSLLLGVPSPIQTDSYRMSGKIQGDWPSFAISEAQVNLSRDGETLTGTGRIADIATFDNIDVALDVRGGNLRDLSEFVGETLPQTRSFQLSGTLRGSWPTLSASRAKASLIRKDIAVELNGSVGNLQDLTLVDIDVAVSGLDLSQVPELSEYELPVTDHFEFEGNLTGPVSRLSVNDMQLLVERGQHRVTLSGDMANAAEFDGIDWQLSAAGADLSELNASIGLNFPPTQSYRLTANLAGSAESLNAQDIELEGIAPGVRLELAGRIGRVADLHDMDLTVLIAAEDLTSLSAYLGWDLLKLEAFEISGHLFGSAPDLNLNDFTFRSGNSLVLGSVGLRTGERLSVVGAVSSGVLDLRPYLLAVQQDAVGDVQIASDRVFSDDPFDLTALDAFDMRLTLDDLELLSSGGNLIVKKATIELQEGSLTIEPLQLARNETTVAGHFQLDRQTSPEFIADLTIENIDLGIFLQDIRAREIYEGRFDLALDLRSRGNSVREVMANLNGQLSAFVSAARIPQVSIPLTKTGIIFDVLPWLQRREDVIVNCAISHMQAANGIVDINLLYLDSAQMTMVGGGTIDLRAEQLDLRLSPRPKRRKILAHNIDVILRGPFIDPQKSNVGAGKSIATDYGKYALLGPLGLLVPTSKAKKHPCVGSLQEFRQQQAAE